jgi:hypothetical protein
VAHANLSLAMSLYNPDTMVIVTLNEL